MNGPSTRLRTNALAAFALFLALLALLACSAACSATRTSEPGFTREEDASAVDAADASVFDATGSSDATTAEATATDAPHKVGGQITGLRGSGLELSLDDGQRVTPARDGTFEFADALPVGTPWTVTVTAQPKAPEQVCTVTKGRGTIAGADVTDVHVQCVTSRFDLGGTVTGLVGSGLVLENVGDDTVGIGGNGPFVFPTRVASGAAFDVRVKAQPSAPSQTCTVSAGAGQVVDKNVTSVVVNCATDSYTLGGSVRGLGSGATLVLQSGTGENLDVTVDGAFAFPTPLVSGTAYFVAVRVNPTSPAQECTVQNAAGTVGGENVTSVVVTCATRTFAVGGTVSGLQGSGLVLRNGGGDDLVVAGDGTFSFATHVPSGGTYDVTVSTPPSSPTQSCVVDHATGTVAAQAVTNVTVTCTVSRFPVGGTVFGLAGTGLVLTNGGGDALPVSTDGTFTFPTQVASGSPYAVAVGTQPSSPSQTCSVVGGSGTVGSGAVTSVLVNCSTSAFAIGGTVTGLASGASVAIRNGSDTITVASNGTFAFPTPVASGSTYSVSVATQPTTPYQTCTVTDGRGTVGGANVSGVRVECRTNRYTVGVVVSGLAGSGFVLANGTDTLTVTADGTASFPVQVESGVPYAVTVRTAPSSPTQTCVVTGGSGTIANAAVVANVVCTTDSFGLGGRVTGLVAGTTVVLRANGAEQLSVVGAAGGADVPFAFPTRVPSATTFTVDVAQKPVGPSQTCTVTNGTGTVGGQDVTNVVVACAIDTFVVRAAVAGLASGTLVLANGADRLNVTANGTSAFATRVASGGTYDVTIATLPANHACTVTSGSGTVGNGDVTVNVVCQGKKTVGGTLSGLSGTAGLTVKLNAGAPVALTTNGTFTLPGAFDSGETYTVAIDAQPTSPAQTCVITNGSGTIGTANVTNVQIACTRNSYTVGGTVTGLGTGSTLVLRNNGANPTTITTNGAYSFSTKILSGNAYAVTVFTNPTTPGAGQTCTVAPGTASGTVGGADVGNVDVTCVTNGVVSVNVTGLVGSPLVLSDNGAFDTLSVTGAGTSAFAKPIPVGQAYAVTVKTNPTNFAQTCTVTGGTGTMTGTGVTVAVACAGVTRVDVSDTTTRDVADGAGSCSAPAAGAATTITFTVPAGVTFDVNQVALSLTMQHTYAGDLHATLAHGATTLDLFDRPGPSGGVCQTSRDFAGTYRFVDTGGTMSSGSASVIAPGDYRATTTADAVVTLDANAPGGFKGLAAAGVWTVTVTDMGTIDTGKVTGVRLELR